MKLTLFSTAICFIFLTPADNCTMYAPGKEGTVLELKSFSSSDKPESSNRLKVMKVQKGENGSRIEMLAETFDKKEKSMGTSTYELVCENGTYFVDMRTMISSEQLSAFKDMKLTIEGDRLDIPADPKPGMELKNGTMKVKGTLPDNPFSMNLTMTVANRKVEALENVTVPAGTFPCVKITFDVESKMMVKSSAKVAEWYSKEIGLVRSETYSSKSKLQGYTVLNSIR